MRDHDRPRRTESRSLHDPRHLAPHPTAFFRSSRRLLGHRYVWAQEVENRSVEYEARASLTEPLIDA